MTIFYENSHDMMKLSKQYNIKVYNVHVIITTWFPLKLVIVKIAVITYLTKITNLKFNLNSMRACALLRKKRLAKLIEHEFYSICLFSCL